MEEGEDKICGEKFSLQNISDFLASLYLVGTDQDQQWQQNLYRENICRVQCSASSQKCTKKSKHKSEAQMTTFPNPESNFEKVTPFGCIMWQMQ